MRLVAGASSYTEIPSGNATRESASDDPYRSLPTRKTHVRRCAECDEPLQRTLVGDLDQVLDSCPPHGIWFDAGELARTTRYFAGDGVDLGPDPDPDVDPVTLALLSRAQDSLF